MKKTYITNMPNHIGAFLKASKCFSELGINITRVSYNKSVDIHTAFIQVEGDEEKLNKLESELNKIGYIADPQNNEKVILLEFKLEKSEITESKKVLREFRLFSKSKFCNL